jgi:hypothetical protein
MRNLLLCSASTVSCRMSSSRGAAPGSKVQALCKRSERKVVCKLSVLTSGGNRGSEEVLCLTGKSTPGKDTCTTHMLFSLAFNILSRIHLQGRLTLWQNSKVQVVTALYRTAAQLHQQSGANKGAGSVAQWTSHGRMGLHIGACSENQSSMHRQSQKSTVPRLDAPFCNWLVQ